MERSKAPASVVRRADDLDGCGGASNWKLVRANGPKQQRSPVLFLFRIQSSRCHWPRQAFFITCGRRCLVVAGWAISCFPNWLDCRRGNAHRSPRHGPASRWGCPGRPSVRRQTCPCNLYAPVFQGVVRHAVCKSRVLGCLLWVEVGQSAFYRS